MADKALPPIGERLRQARLDRGMTVRGLARLVDLSASLISQIETGRSSPSVSTLYAITGALGISIEDVFSAGSADESSNGSQATSRAASASPASAVARSGAVAEGGPGGAPDPSAAAALSAGAAAALTPADAAALTPADRPAVSAASQGQRMLQRQRRVGPVVTPGEREVLHLDSGVTWELLGQLPDTHVDFLRITYAPGGSSSGIGVLMRHSGTEFGHVLSGQLTLTLGFDTYVLNPGDSVSFDCSTPHSYANHGVEPAMGVWFVAERFR